MDRRAIERKRRNRSSRAVGGKGETILQKVLSQDKCGKWREDLALWQEAGELSPPSVP